MFDATACKLVMANAVVFLDQTWRSSSSAFDATAESAKYYTQSCKELSLRLSDPGDRIGDGVIATVLGFLCHDVSCTCPSALVLLVFRGRKPRREEHRLIQPPLSRNRNTGGHDTTDTV